MTINAETLTISKQIMDKEYKSEQLFVKKRNGRLEPLNLDKINQCALRACKDISDVSPSEIVIDAHMQLYNKVTTAEIDKALILSARSKIEKEPNYAFAAARLLANTIYKEVFGEGVDHDGFELQYKKSFIINTRKLVKSGRLSEKLLEFDLKRLADALDIERDKQFKYLGLQILYDRYFIHIDGRRMESPQAFWMRVAMGIAIGEQNKEERAIEFYNLLSSFRSVSATPTLFNSGTIFPQMSSCYLSTQSDSIDGIFHNYRIQARLSKFSGGLGIDYTPCRGTGAHIKGTNGVSSGLIPWIKIMGDTANAVNQSGKRKGAACVYLQPWHIDVEDFLELRKPIGDERRRTVDLNLANYIPDLFMKRVMEDGPWYLFSPDETPELIDLYGDEFNKKYNQYVEKGKNGELSIFREVSAKDLWKKMLSSQMQFGGPWITFKDPINIRNPQKHVGSIRCSNLCTETTLVSSPTLYDKSGNVDKFGEVAVCNLQALNLGLYVLSSSKIDWDSMAKDVNTSIRMLDNVIDQNYYPVIEAELSNKRHRPVMLGIMGWHDMLLKLDMVYASEEAVELAGRVQEFISYHSILASSKLAEERGTYETYEGSSWSEGKMPQDTYYDLARYRNKDVVVKEKMPWSTLREQIKKNGMRNSNLTANQPTATISYIVGCSQSFEAYYKILYTYSTLSGETTVVCDEFYEELKRNNLLCPELIKAMKDVKGDVMQLNIPNELKEKYQSPFYIDFHFLVDANMARQVWVDQSQSLNLFNSSQSLKHTSDIYMYCFDKMCKTTYYLRGQAASGIKVLEDSINENERKKLVCSLEAMAKGEVCEACQ